VALVLVLFAILASYVGPSLDFLDAWRGSRDERAQLQELSREHSRLVAREAALKSPDAASVKARRMGMIASGERAYVVRSPRR
jgi:cell division protein FtsB